MKSKQNNTAVRALEVLRLLSYEDITQEEIITHIFSAKKSEYELRTDSLYKYFNTFKLFGINICKNKGKYSLEKSVFLSKFTEKEIETMNFLYSYAKKIYKDENLKEFKLLLENVLKYTNQPITINEVDIIKYLKNSDIKTNKENLEKFCQLCKDNQRISFDYFNKFLNKLQSFTVEPNEVILTPAGEILKAFNPEIAEIQNFNIDEITNLKQFPVMSKSMNIKNSVTFKLKGRLALSYELKKGERVITMEQNSIVVSNSEEDKQELLKRLLRYGVSCEILYPKTFKTKFLNTLDKIKSIYE